MEDSRIPSFCIAIRIRTLETDFSTLPPPDLDRAGDTEIALRRGDDLATEDMSWETEREPKKSIGERYAKGFLENQVESSKIPRTDNESTCHARHKSFLAAVEVENSSELSRRELMEGLIVPHCLSV